MISYGSADFENFKRSNISRSEFSFYAEPLNTSSRGYSEIYKVTNFKLQWFSSFVCIALFLRLGCL
jgi:hypothetical protein